MTNIDRGAVRNELLGDEGDEAFAYDDATGKRLMRGDTLQGNLSIAVGYNLSSRPLSARVRSLMTDESIDECVADLLGLAWFVALDEVRTRAVINLRFQLGKGGFAGFHQFIGAMSRKDYQEAERQLRDSDWFRDPHVQLTRKTRVCAQILTGANPT